MISSLVQHCHTEFESNIVETEATLLAGARKMLPPQNMGHAYGPVRSFLVRKVWTTTEVVNLWEAYLVFYFLSTISALVD